MNNAPLLVLGWWLCLLGLCAATAVVHAQPTPERERLSPIPEFEQYWLDEGLSVSQVNALAQDEQGFLWVGTEHGLNRFDGYTFKVYSYDPEEPHSLSHDFITALHVDAAGILWVGTLRGGLCRYVRERDDFVCYAEAAGLPRGGIFALTTTPDGVLWVGVNESRRQWLIRKSEGRGSLCHLVHSEDAQTSRFTCFQASAEVSTATDDVRALWPNNDGTLWVGTGHGLLCFDPANATFSCRPTSTLPEALRSGTINTLYEAPALPGVLWVGTFDAGLFRYEPASGTLTSYRHNPADATSLSSNNVISLQAGQSTRLWVGTRHNGLDYLDLSSSDTGRLGFHHATHNPLDLGAFDQGTIASLYEDNSGKLWVGTFKGLFKHNPAGQKFNTYHDDASPANSLAEGVVQAVHAEENGTFWVSSRGAFGFYRIDPSGRIVSYTASLQSAGIDVVRAMTMVPGDTTTLWLTTNRGLVRFHPSSRQARIIPGEVRPSADGLSSLLTPDSDSTFWINSGGTPTIAHFNVNTERFTVYPVPGLVDEGIASITFDPLQAGVLWLGSWNNGLYRFDLPENTFTHFSHDPQDPHSLSGIEIWSILADPDDPAILWVAAYRAGFNRFDTRTGKAERFTRYNSDLPGNGIGSIKLGSDGKLWMASNHGLIRFDRTTHDIKVYDSDDGLRSRELNYPGLHQGPDEQLYLHTHAGVRAFRPEDLADDPHPPKVVITDFQIEGEPVGIGAGSPLDRHISVTDRLVLDHDQNDLTFDYVGLHFGYPERNRYAYRLAGYDDTWREGTMRTASFTNLPPGTYTLEVRAANADGVWTEEPLRLALTIRPPWWRTLWAYAVYGLFFLGGVFAVDRVQRRRLLAKEREQARERELAQAREIEQAYHQLRETKDRLVQQEKMASLGALTAGIAHEIKNPLNFINNFAEVNEELADELQEALANGESVDDIIADLKQNAAVIAQHGKRADGIVRSMMAHAREGKGEREAVNLNALIDEHVELAYHGKRAQVPGFNATIERDYDESVGQVEVVPQEFGRVILNLVSNAFDAVMEQAVRVNGQYEPVVRVVSCRKADGVEIRVEDNGPGMPEEVKAKVFEPFFTTKPTGSGTGLGLSLSYDIITQGHGGTLTVESEAGEGAAFILTLPTLPTDAQA